MIPGLSTRCVALALILALGAALGCIRTPDREYGGHGDIISIGAHKPQLLDSVVYTWSDGQNYEITPAAEGASIAAVRVRAVNQTSTQVTLSIDPAAAALTGADGDVFRPFEPSTRHVETDADAPADNPYGAHFWGNYQLLRKFQVAGWFFFEVPDGTDFVDFGWEDVEFVRVPYPR